MSFIKIKNFSFSQDTAKRTERQATNWETIFANTYLMKDLQVPNLQRTIKTQESEKNPVKTWVEGLKRNLTRDDIQMQISTLL